MVSRAGNSARAGCLKLWRSKMSKGISMSANYYLVSVPNKKYVAEIKRDYGVEMEVCETCDMSF